jgi:hypothetical protein
MNNKYMTKYTSSLVIKEIQIKMRLKFHLITVRMTIKKTNTSWAPVVHTCNLNYLGSRDQQDGILKPAQANSWQDKSQTKNHNKGIRL